MKRHFLKILIMIFSLLTFWGCATVSDSVVSAIDQEQYIQLNNMYRLIQDYRFNHNRNSLNEVWNELNSIDTRNIYNLDYKAKIFGLKSLTLFYFNRKTEVRSLLKDLQEMTEDEELYWIVLALLENEKEIRLKILLEGRDKIYSIDRLNSYLAESYLENEMYGESTAIFDSILLSEEDFVPEYQKKRDLSYMFMQNPPSSYENGMIIAKDQIDGNDLIAILSRETNYFSVFNKDDITKTLLEKSFFFNNVFQPEKPLVRKDLAYFLFALIADRKRSENLWDQYSEYFDSDFSEEMKNDMEGLSPISDIPIYKYYFYPALYLVEEEIMELPDGANFFPNKIVPGGQLLNVISNLKKRVD